MDKKWWLDALVNPNSVEHKVKEMEKGKNPLTPIYIKMKDLNDGSSYGDYSDARPKPAVEIGLKFDF